VKKSLFAILLAATMMAMVFAGCGSAAGSAADTAAPELRRHFQRRYASTKSEHDPGLAIDLNVDSNYFCEPDGTPITGSHWDPENDPYSIPIDRVIERTFRKYGFTRGIYWRNGTKDYMHFSFFGY